MSKEVYRDEWVTLLCGDCREALPVLPAPDCYIADPPYVETRQEWDEWPTGWVSALRRRGSLWCFGSLRMFLKFDDEFAGWRMAQDVVWEKQNGTGLHNDRFRRVHELIAQFYPKNQAWDLVHKEPQFTMDARARNVRRQSRPGHWGHLRNEGSYVVEDGGPRLVRSVMRAKNMHRRGIHPNQKPGEVLEMLVRYSCPPGGLVIDPFAGSGSTLVAARKLKRKAIGIEKSPFKCERAAEWLRSEQE